MQEDGYSDSEVKPTFINQPHLQADKNPRIRRSQTLAAGERDAGHLTAPEREAAGMKRVVKQVLVMVQKCLLSLCVMFALIVFAYSSCF